jgi:hypothetical protein
MNLSKLKQTKWDGPYESDDEMRYSMTIPRLGVAVIHIPKYGDYKWLSVSGVRIPQITSDMIDDVIKVRKEIQRNTIIGEFLNWLGNGD